MDQHHDVPKPYLELLSDIQKKQLPGYQLPIEVQDHKNLKEIQNVELEDQEKLAIEIPGLEKKPSIKVEDNVEQLDLQQVLANEVQDVETQSPSGNLAKPASQPFIHRHSGKIPPMPSEETMRHSIADNLMEILVNMVSLPYRQQCFELLQVSDPLQARSRILSILQQIDEERRAPI
ncbi:uncharacterized protein LOC108048992 [Drosophila rhopaloa]|uniref:Uncharacterized protein LOC108048992 n=1 Tax=Drosophila rhopaloa TaxID=1041015 RepID=A0A6P4F4W5_DRORH|nr:uncharacterized protein LOC108048992 [Drosophila rhopaloa]